VVTDKGLSGEETEAFFAGPDDLGERRGPPCDGPVAGWPCY